MILRRENKWLENICKGFLIPNYKFDSCRGHHKTSTKNNHLISLVARSADSLD